MLTQPDRAYFGQKDIQQAMVLRRLVDDLLFRYPLGRQNVRVLPTERDPADQVALSSRNAYLDTEGRGAAPLLYQALSHGQRTWEALLTQDVPASERIEATLAAVRHTVDQGAAALAAQTPAEAKRAKVALDYVCLNDPATLEELTSDAGTGAILSGALWVHNDAKDAKPATRIIDNLLLGFSLD